MNKPNTIRSPWGRIPKDRARRTVDSPFAEDFRLGPPEETHTVKVRYATRRRIARKDLTTTLEIVAVLLRMESDMRNSNLNTREMFLAFDRAVAGFDKSKLAAAHAMVNATDPLEPWPPKPTRMAKGTARTKAGEWT